MSDRALVLPGLVPLTAANVAAVLAVRDGHLALAARICGFEPDRLDPGRDSAALSTTVHEALLAVAVVRRLEREPAGSSYRAYGGMSAGCVTALLAAGVLTEEGCFRIVGEINSLQIQAHRADRSGTTLAVLTASAEDAYRLVEELWPVAEQPWLSVDLGDGLVAISIRGGDPDVVGAELNRLGAIVLDRAERAEHSPYTVPGREDFARVLDGIDFRTASAAVLSPLTGKPVDNTPAAHRRLLIDQSFDTASLPRLTAGLCGVDGVGAVDLIAPAKSVYVPRTRSLLRDRAEHRLLALPG
ncbi:hypothetical protein L1606_30580 [Streptomyces spororaveus]|uniref:hypothetical protein n=1 Tax=Streptomyces spororaveus TaxID=284039 RepID=UPI002079F91A|nr:hypothetical protein [Streptomyces spororaveus]MCM9082380.1 hypothetical protein [Streptomyces spororaveus]